MPIETVGSSEAILQLVAAFQGRNGKRPNPLKIWSSLAIYTNSGGSFKFYPLAKYDPERPAGEFLLDIADLVKRGFLLPLPGGKVELTPLGRCVTFAKAVPASLVPLEREMETMSSAE